MSITLFLSKNLSRIADGTEGFEVDGQTVGDCVNDLVSMIPAMRNALFYESQLSRGVEVQVNKKIIDETERLARKVKDGDEIDIMLKGH